ncbi:hypothetical protein ACFOSV_11575 [Algoriphagus namhaensis]|uniref:Outer membrane protein beta-barrel domain-containing protein n=1 Tax=Algoriphagus namhaensis TaxID=915353 RepID=A0ABV8AS56_9BACT
MKKNLLLLLVFVAFCISPAFGQIKKINLNLIYGELNGGMPIPAEEQFAVTGAVPDKIEMVKLTIFPSKKSEKAGASYFWKSPFGYKDEAFQINVEQPLRSNDDYELEFRFYQKAGPEQIREVAELVYQNLETYLSTITTIKKGGVEFSESIPNIMSQMASIVESGTFYFELPNGQPFPGFSDITRAKLEQHKNLKMGKAKYNATGLGENDNARAVYARTYLDEVYAIIGSELKQYFSPNMLVMVDEKIFKSYRSENKPNVIPLNAGYGAISLSKNLQEQEFVASPYVGVSFPLGNRAFNKFMNNLSLSTGVFLSGKMENSLGERISGPVIDRPIYVGLGYNFFRFIRLNAGGTFITTEQLNGTNQNSFNPFIGVSAEFNLWLGIGKKK